MHAMKALTLKLFIQGQTCLKYNLVNFEIPNIFFPMEMNWGSEMNKFTFQTEYILGEAALKS